MLPDIDQVYIASAFADSPSDETVYWIGRVQEISKGRELIPIHFFGTRYLVAFLEPVTEAGDHTSLVISANTFAGGFLPCKEVVPVI